MRYFHKIADLTLCCLVTSFYCTLRILKITFPESGYSYLKGDIKERFIV